MNLRNMTIALMVALAYEICLKLCHLLMPSLFNQSPISSIVSVLSSAVGVIIILFMFSFYEEERPNRKVEIVLRILIVSIILHFIFRLPITRSMIDYRVARLVGETMGFIKAILLFALLIFYGREIPSGEKSIKQAAVLVTVVFGIGVTKSLYSLISFASFAISGVTVNYPPILYNIMFILFLVTHISIIYFLYRYYQLKSYAK